MNDRIEKELVRGWEMNDCFERELMRGWEVMEKGLTKLKSILEGLPESPFSFEDHMILYSAIYNMCTLKPPCDHSHQLYMYNKYKQVFAEYFQETVLPSLREKYDEFMLRELVKRWSNHKVMVQWLSHFFEYINRYFIGHTHSIRKSFPPLKEVGYTCFLDMIYQEISGKSKDAILSLINLEREGGQIDKALLKKVLDVYVEFGFGSTDIYDNDFETPMLIDTVDYYARKASNWIMEDSCSTYMLKSEDCIKREKDRADQYLHSKSERKLLEKVRNELLLVYENQLLEKCLALLNNDQASDISRMYGLFSKVPQGIESIASLFQKYISHEGKTLLEGIEDTTVFVRKMIELHNKCLSYVTDCFQSHTKLCQALIVAFEVFLNQRVTSSVSAVLLAIFCNNILKKDGGEKLSGDAIEDSLEKVVKVLAYVDDKDLFGEVYRRKLSSRLLRGQSVNEYHERSIMTRLKQQNSQHFISKMERMITDWTLARENQTEFKEYLGQNSDANLGLDLSVTILNKLAWPTFKSSNINLPKEMVKCVDVFTQFYQITNEDKKLTWVHSFGSCNIIGRFDKKPIELIVDTYQAATIMLFNTTDRLSYTEIATQLNLAEADLVRVLHSLSCEKYMILIKEPSSGNVSNTDYFLFNSSFTDRKRRIRVGYQTSRNTSGVFLKLLGH